MNPYAFELQRNDGFVSRQIPNDGIAAECQAAWLAKANRETLVGVYEDARGISRRVLYRPV